MKKGWAEKNAWKSLIVIVLGFSLCAAILAELALSILAVGPVVPRQRFVRLREWPPGFKGAFTPTDTYMSYCDSLVRAKYPISIESDGFINPSRVWAANEKDVIGIFFLGGSTTECLYVKEAQRFPYLVGRILEHQTGKRINSFNCGCSGNNSMHSNIVLLGKVLALKGHVAVMMHNINDLIVLLYEGTYFNHNQSRSIVVERPPRGRLAALKDATFPRLWSALREHWLFKRFFRRAEEQDEWANVRGRSIQVDKESLLRDFSKSLECFVGLCKAEGIVPVLMTQPSRLLNPPDPAVRRHAEAVLTVVSYKDLCDLHHAFNQQIKETALRRGVRVIDLAGRIPPRKAYMYDAFHFNGRGSELAAQIISEAVAPILTNLPVNAR